MRGNFYKLTILFLSLCIYTGTSVAQEEKQYLEQRRSALLQQINETNSLLTENKVTTSSKLANFKLLNTKLNNQSVLLLGLSSEIGAIKASISKLNKEITQQNKDLSQLRSNYSKSIVSAYKQKSSMNNFAFILSSKSFNSAITRLNYLKKLNTYRARQAETIKVKIADLQDNRSKLLVQEKEKNQLLAIQTDQMNQLASTKESLEKVITELKDEKSDLSSILQTQKLEQEQLQAEIRIIIARELAAERERALKAAAENTKNIETVENETALEEVETPKNVEPTFKAAPINTSLSAKFSENRGKLPWPTGSGIIVSSMGQYGNSDLPGIKQDRDGIDIRTNENATVKSIYNGQVRSITAIPGFNKVVIISHGDYFSVYGKLQDVQVKSGDSVNAGDTIGVVETKDGISEVHLQLWKGQERLNPSDWLQNQ